MNHSNDSPSKVEGQKPPGNWFRIDNDVIDTYGQLIGPIGIAAYAYLSRRANRKRECWFAYRTIAVQLGISRPTAIKAIRRLIEVGLIDVRLAKNSLNKYILLPVGHTRGVNGVNPRGKDSLPRGVNGVNPRGKDSLPKQYTRTRSNKQDTPPNPLRGFVGDQVNGFEEFFEAYPNKIRKKAALKAWKKLNPSPELVKRILGAIDAQKKSAQWIKRGVIPAPDNWLSGERWEDEPAEPADQILDGVKKFINRSNSVEFVPGMEGVYGNAN